MVPFFVFLFCLFATYGTYLLVTRKSAEDRARLEKRWRDVLLGQEEGGDEGTGSSGKAGIGHIGLARSEILSEIPRFDEMLKKIEFVTWVKKMIDQSDLQLTVMRLFMFCGLSGMLGMMAVSMLSEMFLAAILAGLITACLPFLHMMWKRKKRLDKFLADLPDTLE